MATATTTASAAVPVARAPALAGQTVVVIGGSSGIGFETGRQALAEGAEVVLAARDPARLEQAARRLDVRRTAVVDAHDPDALQALFHDLPGPIDHVMVTAGAPPYGPPLQMSPEQVRLGLTDHALLALGVARNAVGRVRPGGCLLFMSGTGERPHVGQGILATAVAAMPTLIANLALEVAPIRINLIAAGFVDTPLSASLLGQDLDRRRAELRTKLPIRRVVGPADVAALAVHVMTNTALTGATFDVDGGQQLLGD